MMQMVTCTLRFAASLSAAATIVLMAAKFRYFREGSSAADATNTALKQITRSFNMAT
jgi:hypothetical protein